MRTLALLTFLFAGGISASAEAAAPSPTAPLAATPVSEVMNFALLDHQGRLHEMRRAGGRAVVLFFTANGCPIVRQNVRKFKALSDRFASQGVKFLLVNSSPGDTREEISKESRELGIWHLPVLKDDTQGVARHLRVRRTAEIIAISTKDWTPFYRGALDDQMVEGAQKPAAEAHYLEQALTSFLSDTPIAIAKTVARGCLIHLDGGEGPDDAPVSYSQSVAPILLAKCVECHSAGNVGSWAMSGHRKVKSMSSMIEETLITRRMPPWDADPHVGRFKNDSSLSVAEAQTLLRWIHQGSPRGEGPDPLEGRSVAAQSEWPLGKPDIILKLPRPETIPASGVLDYRHIEVPAGNPEEAWLGAIWVKPGNLKIVHHVIGRLKQGGRKDAVGQGEMLVGWAPGTTQGWFPTNTGKHIPAQARFDIEMHYTPNGTEQTDQTEIGLYLLPEKPVSRFEAVPLVDFTFEIPPGDPDSKTQALYCFKKGATLYSVTPHMHLRGKWMKFEALWPNGKRELLCSVPRYDFNWQRTYELDKPRKIPPGTWVMISGGYDNSPQNPANPDPKKAVHWGDQSFDEMFLGWYNVAWDPEAPKQTAALK